MYQSLCNIRNTNYDIFVIVCLLLQPKSVAARIVLDRGIHAAMQRANEPKLQHLDDI